MAAHRAAALVWLGMVAALAVAIGPRASSAAAGSPDEPLPLRIVDAGFALAAPFPADAPRRIRVALRVENPNAELAAEGIIAEVSLVDGGGTPVASARVAIDYLLPGERRVVTTRLEVAPEVAETVAAAETSLEGPAAWRRGCAAPLLGVELFRSIGVGVPPGVRGLTYLSAVHNPALTGGRIIGFYVPQGTATIANPTDYALTDVAVAAIAFDRDGRVVGGGERTYAIPPRGAVRAEVGMTASVELHDIARVEVTAAYPALDLASCE